MQGSAISGNGSVLGDSPVLQDKAYFEVTIVEPGSFAVGLATKETPLDGVLSQARQCELTLLLAAAHNLRSCGCCTGQGGDGMDADQQSAGAWADSGRRGDRHRARPGRLPRAGRDSSSRPRRTSPVSCALRPRVAPPRAPSPPTASPSSPPRSAPCPPPPPPAPRSTFTETARSSTRSAASAARCCLPSASRTARCSRRTLAARTTPRAYQPASRASSRPRPSCRLHAGSSRR